MFYKRTCEFVYDKNYYYGIKYKNLISRIPVAFT